jgi:hypothetical protein
MSINNNSDMWNKENAATVFSKPFHASKDESAKKRLCDLSQTPFSPIRANSWPFLSFFGTAVKPLREYTAQVNALGREDPYSCFGSKGSLT